MLISRKFKLNFSRTLMLNKLQHVPHSFLHSWQVRRYGNRFLSTCLPPVQPCYRRQFRVLVTPVYLRLFCPADL
jgi:hypothetical protein